MIREVCTGSLEEVLEAFEKGADRVEFCSNLEVGGLTPNANDLNNIKINLRKKTTVMIRNRAGNFNFTNLEFKEMLKQISLIKKLGYYGIVIGFTINDFKMDYEKTKIAIELAKPMSISFHRAFDNIDDKFSVIDQLAELGVDRILTTGGPEKAIDGIEILKKLQKYSNGKLEIMPGSGVTKFNLEYIKNKTNCNEFHGTKII